MRGTLKHPTLYIWYDVSLFCFTSSTGNGSQHVVLLWSVDWYRLFCHVLHIWQWCSRRWIWLSRRSVSVSDIMSLFFFQFSYFLYLLWGLIDSDASSNIGFTALTKWHFFSKWNIFLPDWRTGGLSPVFVALDWVTMHRGLGRALRNASARVTCPFIAALFSSFGYAFSLWPHHVLISWFFMLCTLPVWRH